MATQKEIDSFIAFYKKEIEDHKKKMKANYQRGDAMTMADLNMFLSIWENTKPNETKEERFQVLRDHGWTIGEKDAD